MALGVLELNVLYFPFPEAIPALIVDSRKGGAMRNIVKGIVLAACLMWGPLDFSAFFRGRPI